MIELGTSAFAAKSRRKLASQLLFVLFVLFLMIASPSFANTDTNLPVVGVGAQTGSTNGYVVVGSATSGSCVYNTIYIDVSNDTGKVMMSAALTARATGSPLSRVDYTVSAGNICIATLLQM